MLEIFILFAYLRVKACYRCTLSGKYVPARSDYEYTLLEKKVDVNSFISELIPSDVEMEKTHSEGLLWWLKAKDILLCDFVGKCFHVHVVLQSVYAYALFYAFRVSFVVHMFHIMNFKTI